MVSSKAMAFPVTTLGIWLKDMNGPSYTTSPTAVHIYTVGENRYSPRIFTFNENIVGGIFLDIYYASDKSLVTRFKLRLLLH